MAVTIILDDPAGNSYVQSLADDPTQPDIGEWGVGGGYWCNNSVSFKKIYKKKKQLILILKLGYQQRILETRFLIKEKYVIMLIMNYQCFYSELLREILSGTALITLIHIFCATLLYCV